MPSLTSPARLALVASVILALVSCAHHSPDGKPAICDGRHRRPANPYGSVLPVFPGQADAKPGAPGAKAPPPPPPGPLSAIDPRSLAPCGSRA